MKRPVPVPSSTPIVARIARTVSGARSWFLAEKGSMDGGTIQVGRSAAQDGTYCRREKTNPCALAR
jgi:hypothetical protein